MNQFMLPPHRRSRYATTASAFSSIQLATGYVVPLVQATEWGSGAGSFRRMLAPTLASSKPPVSLSKQGDIPDAYWAALMHPVTTQDAGLLK